MFSNQNTSTLVVGAAPAYHCSSPYRRRTVLPLWGMPLMRGRTRASNAQDSMRDDGSCGQHQCETHRAPPGACFNCCCRTNPSNAPPSGLPDPPDKWFICVCMTDGEKHCPEPLGHRRPSSIDAALTQKRPCDTHNNITRPSKHQVYTVRVIDWGYALTGVLLPDFLTPFHQRPLIYYDVQFFPPAQHQQPCSAARIASQNLTPTLRHHSVIAGRPALAGHPQWLPETLNEVPANSSRMSLSVLFHERPSGSPAAAMKRDQNK